MSKEVARTDAQMRSAGMLAAKHFEQARSAAAEFTKNMIICLRWCSELHRQAGRAWDRIEPALTNAKGVKVISRASFTKCIEAWGHLKSQLDARLTDEQIAEHLLASGIKSAPSMTAFLRAIKQLPDAQNDPNDRKAQDEKTGNAELQKPLGRALYQIRWTAGLAKVDLLIPQPEQLEQIEAEVRAKAAEGFEKLAAALRASLPQEEQP